MIFAKRLGNALGEVLRENQRVVLLGEDIVDPYGGAFKVTRGLSTEFPERVRATPVSEGAIAGISGGLALSGYRPIAEIMFGDFMTLCLDQLLNHISKYEAMYDGKVSCPVLIRTPFGGGRGYGPTHSQSLEKFFCGIPHLGVFAASLYHDPKPMLDGLLAAAKPALIAEHKLLYPREFEAPDRGILRGLQVRKAGGVEGLETLSLAAVDPQECELSIVAYGYQASVVEEIVRAFAYEEERFIELLVPAQLSPLDLQPIVDSVQRTQRLITVEEGTAGWSWGTEVASRIHTACFGQLAHPVKVLTSAPDVIPSARHLENEVLIAPSAIKAAIQALLP